MDLYETVMKERLSKDDLEALKIYFNCSKDQFFDKLDEAIGTRFQEIIQDRSAAHKYYQENFGDVKDLAIQFKNITEGSFKELSTFIKCINVLNSLKLPSVIFLKS